MSRPAASDQVTQSGPSYPPRDLPQAGRRRRAARGYRQRAMSPRRWCPRRSACAAAVITREAAVLCGGRLGRRDLPAARRRRCSSPGTRTMASRWRADDVIFEIAGAGARPAHRRAHRAQLPADCCPARRPTTRALRRCRGRHRLPHPRHSQDRCPGCALAQKYAVRCGGADNHRMGSVRHDAHQGKPHRRRGLDHRGHRGRAGSARPAVTVEVEVESLARVRRRRSPRRPDIIMLDEFSTAMTCAPPWRCNRAQQRAGEARGLRQRRRSRTCARSPRPASTTSRSARSPSTLRAIDLSMRWSSSQRTERGGLRRRRTSARAGAGRCHSPARSRRRGWSASG